MILNDGLHSIEANDALMKGTIMRGYALALSLIAFVILVSAGVLHTAISGHYKDTEVINVAGAQRMLSQRLIALAKGGGGKPR